MEGFWNYLRSITEVLPMDSVSKKGAVPVKQFLDKYTGKFLFLYLGILVLILSLLSLTVYVSYQSRQEEYMSASEQLVYWEDVIRANPNYPDAYYNAAYFAARTGNSRLALRYVDSALYLDRDFEEAKELKEEILN